MLILHEMQFLKDLLNKNNDFTEQIAHSTLHSKYLKTRGAIRGHKVEP